MREDSTSAGDAASRPPDDLARQSAVVGLLLAIFCLCYAYELTNFNLSIDEELFAFEAPPWTGLGRWAAQLVTLLLWPQPTAPFGPFLLFGIFGSIGYAILLRAFGIERPRAVHFVLFPSFIAFPVWFNQIEFSPLVVANGIAIAVCCGAALLTRRAIADWSGWISKGLCAVALLAFAVGIYQSFLLFYLVLGIAVASVESELPPSVHLRRLGFVAGVGVLGSIAGLAIGWLALFLSGTSLSPYAESFLRIDALLSHPGLVFTLLRDEVAATYVSDWMDFGRAGHVFLVAYIVSAGLVLAAPQSPSRRLVRLAILVAIACVPFGFNLFMGAVLPIRSYVAVPAAVWCILFFPLLVSRSPVVERATFTVALVVFVQIVYVQAIVQARSWTVQRRDLLLAGAIYDRIAQVGEAGSGREATKVQFYGTRPVVSPYPMVSTATGGASFFDWDGGNTHRIVAFMKLIGFGDLMVASAEDCRKVLRAFAAMPSWPAAASVKLEGEVVLVKLSDEQAMGCH